MDYAIAATAARRKVIDMIYKAQSSHIGSNLSVIDIATVLYEHLNLTAELLPDRDRVIWSKGWAAATAYYFLAAKGILTTDDLNTYGAAGGRLLGLVERGCRGIEASTGSMGHGLPIGIGMALASKLSGVGYRTFVIMSDGEMDCGTTWESALLGAHHGLGGLVVIVDVNGWQAMGRTRDILDTQSLANKWTSFGWNVRQIDGHDYTAIERALRPTKNGLPTVILADTIKGKGVSVMENRLEWHYRNIDNVTYELACAELS